ncbi:hypothetical protein AVEN_183851-1 [Araneus ventricosus]|uniref:Secreted protein n=1 Tax=Araneus ventricosus TaxID=182803 RepID=A0A4Y2FPS0_ARAVE|nr:hypothetical protein AVEN_183851-1 [Araneus ventricosus]
MAAHMLPVLLRLGRNLNLLFLLVKATFESLGSTWSRGLSWLQNMEVDYLSGRISGETNNIFFPHGGKPGRLPATSPSAETLFVAKSATCI